LCSFGSIRRGCRRVARPHRPSPIGLAYGDSEGTRDLLATELVYQGQRTLGVRITPNGNTGFLKP
jgi:hypothetical protein